MHLKSSHDMTSNIRRSDWLKPGKRLVLVHRWSVRVYNMSTLLLSSYSTSHPTWKTVGTPFVLAMDLTGASSTRFLILLLAILIIGAQSSAKAVFAHFMVFLVLSQSFLLLNESIGWKYRKIHNCGLEKRYVTCSSRPHRCICPQYGTRRVNKWEVGCKCFPCSRETWIQIVLLSWLCR